MTEICDYHERLKWLWAGPLNSRNRKMIYKPLIGLNYGYDSIVYIYIYQLLTRPLYDAYVFGCS